jgi:hypothetical protein
MPGPTPSRRTTPRAPAARAGATCAGSPTTATTGEGVGLQGGGDGDDGHRQTAQLAESRQRLAGVDPGVPQRHLRPVPLDDVDRAELREQAGEPGAKQRIVADQRHFDRIAHSNDR